MPDAKKEKTGRRLRIVTPAAERIRERRAAVPNRVKLLVSILNREDEKVFNDIINDFSVSLAYMSMGEGTVRGAVLSYLGIGRSDKSVMLSLIPESDETDILQRIQDEMSLYLVGNGISFTVPLTAVTEKVENGITSAAASKFISEKNVMKDRDRKFELLVAIVAAGYVDDAIKAARDAGAAGGTIIKSRAVGNEKAEQFLGISLHPDSEMLMVLSLRTNSNAIMDALVKNVGLKTDAHGIIFALPVDRTIGVGGVEAETRASGEERTNTEKKETGKRDAEKKAEERREERKEEKKEENGEKEQGYAEAAQDLPCVREDTGDVAEMTDGDMSSPSGDIPQKDMDEPGNTCDHT